MTRVRTGYVSAWLFIAIALLLAACGQNAAPAGSAKPAVSTSAAASGSPAAVASSAGQAQAKPSAASWDQIVAAAKREGSVVIYGQAGASVSELLTTGFRQQYPDIKVEFNGANGSELETKIQTERQAGRFGVDIMLHGPPNLLHMAQVGVLDPIADSLVGPEGNPSKWLGGKFDFSDDGGRYVLMLLGGVATPAIYNPTMVNLSEITSYRDLLAPKWKGKLAMLDPRIPGNGQGTAQFWVVTPSLGKDFIKQLFDQGVTFTRDDRQLTDWVAHGTYAFGLAANGFEAVQLKKTGAPLEFLSADHLKESGYLTASWGGVGAVNRAAHPNAAKVYLDWLLSKDGQEAMVKASGYASRRQDVPTTGLLDATIPKAGVQYVEITKESYINQRPEIVQYIQSLIGS